MLLKKLLDNTIEIFKNHEDCEERHIRYDMLDKCMKEVFNEEWYKRYHILSEYIKDVFNLPRDEDIKDHILAIEVLLRDGNQDNDPNDSYSQDSKFISTYTSPKTPKINFMDKVNEVFRFYGISQRTQIKVWYKDLLFVCNYENEFVTSILPAMFKEKYISNEDELGLDKMVDRFNYHILRHGDNGEVYKFDNEEAKLLYEEE